MMSASVTGFVTRQSGYRCSCSNVTAQLTRVAVQIDGVRLNSGWYYFCLRADEC